MSRYYYPARTTTFSTVAVLHCPRLGWLLLPFTGVAILRGKKRNLNTTEKIPSSLVPHSMTIAEGNVSVYVVY